MQLVLGELREGRVVGLSLLVIEILKARDSRFLNREATLELQALGGRKQDGGGETE